MNSLFGNIFSPNTLVADTLAMLEKWFPRYIREAERQAGFPVGVLKGPAKYLSRQRFEAIPADMLPLCIVVCPGIISSTMGGNRQYRAVWRLGVGIAHSAETEEEVDRQVKLYGSCIRAMMLQKHGEYGSSDTQWLEEQYDDLPIGDGITMFKAAALWFGADVENVVTKKHGPDAPDDESFGYHTADIVDIDIVKEN